MNTAVKRTVHAASFCAMLGQMVDIDDDTLSDQAFREIVSNGLLTVIYGEKEVSGE